MFPNASVLINSNIFAQLLPRFETDIKHTQAVSEEVLLNSSDSVGARLSATRTFQSIVLIDVLTKAR